MHSALLTQSGVNRGAVVRCRRGAHISRRALPDNVDTTAEPQQVTSTSASYHGPRTASVSRILVAGTKQHSSLRSTLSHSVVGPVSIGLMAAYTTSLGLAAWKHFAVERTRGCETCAGFGISRCDYCQGVGEVQWEGKWGHIEPCPRCVGRRHIRCPSCGGFDHRAMFAHIPRTYTAHDNGPTKAQPIEDVMQTKHQIMATD